MDEPTQMDDRTEREWSARAESSERSERGLVDRVRDQASAQLAGQKDRVTDGLGSIAGAVRKTTDDLRETQHDTLAEYVASAADQLDRLSARLKDRDIGDLLRDAQSLARRRPAMFVGSAFVVGLLAARFLKSSRPEISPALRRDRLESVS